MRWIEALIDYDAGERGGQFPPEELTDEQKRYRKKLALRRFTPAQRIRMLPSDAASIARHIAAEDERNGVY